MDSSGGDAGDVLSPSEGDSANVSVAGANRAPTAVVVEEALAVKAAVVVVVESCASPLLWTPIQSSDGGDADDDSRLPNSADVDAGDSDGVSDVGSGVRFPIPMRLRAR